MVINGYPVEIGLSDGEKKLVSMGAYIIILPDKKFINTKDFTDFGSIEAIFTSTGEVLVELSMEDGNELSVTYRQEAEPSNPQNMEYWIDTGSNTLKRWSASGEMWVDIATTYVKISSANIGQQFQAYDGVTISGLADIGLDGSFVVWSSGDNWIVVTGIIDNSYTLSTQVTVKRQMPLMDFVIESGNRLWGCRYGPNSDGDIVNEIYASKLGDFKNWNCYMGISTDSYTASRGSDGEFTGAISLGGHPIFFKESMLHKVYGNAPSNFQIQDIACRGVQKGSWKSLAIGNEVLYYKSRLGVCAYDGSLPVDISSALGEEMYFNAVGGVHGNLYFISMTDTLGNHHLFTYDTVKRIWHKEDNTDVMQFCSCREELYFISDGKIKTAGGGTESNFPWMVESGIIGTDAQSGNGSVRLASKKYVSRLMIRMGMDAGSSARFFIQYDSCGDWKQVCTLESSCLRTFSVPIRPRRCDHFRLRIEGIGDAKIYSVCKELEQGSDL